MRVNCLTKMIWKDCNRTNNVFSIALWIYIIARAFGSWPFTIEFNAKSRTSRVQVTKLDLIWFLLSLCIYGLFNWFAVFEQIRQLQLSLVEILISQITQISSILVTMLSIAMDMINRNVIWQMILIFHRFDEEVRTDLNELVQL